MINPYGGEMLVSNKSVNTSSETGKVSVTDIFAMYLANVRKCRRFPHTQMLELSCLVQNDGNLLARNQMVESYLPFAVSVARRYQRRGLDLADLVQEANIGLIIAAEKFQPERGFTFGTYAMWWVKQSITRAIHDRGAMIRIPVHLQEKRPKLLAEAEKFLETHGREPTAEELVELTSFRLSEVKKILRLMFLDTKFFDDLGEIEHDRDVYDYHDSLQSHALNPELALLAKGEYFRAVDDLYRFYNAVIRLKLKSVVKDCFFARYGLDDTLDKRTFDDLAQEYGVSHQMVYVRVANVWKALAESDPLANEDWLLSLIERVKDFQDLVN